MSLQDMFLRKMLQSKMKNVPVEEQEKIISIIQKNPGLFQKIALEVQSAMGSGKDQISAMKDVLEKHKEELKNITTEG